MGITLYQQRKTERALEALRDLSSPRALVIRGGSRKRIPGREVVRGDLVMLAEGDRVPADAVLLETTSLTVDESLLTGESVPVRKRAMRTPPARRGSGLPVPPDAGPANAGGDDLPFVFSGTLVVQGQGVAVVRATGSGTELGKIGKALQSLETEDTAIERETRRLVRRLAVLGATLCVIVVVVYGLTRGDWLHGVLAGITLAMATLPEEFPVVLTIFLALGAWRLSQRQVLTRRVPAIETLGAATVLCVDKTGTLTMNQMTVRRIVASRQVHEVRADGQDLPEAFHETVEFAILASQRDPFDPMEKAFKQLGERYLAQTEHLHADWTLVREYPLSERLLAMSHVWRSRETEDYVIAAKGAPEAIADLCHLDDARLRELTAAVSAMAADGLRVLGVARATFRPEALPGEQHEFPFKLLGLVGLEDPVRPTAVDAVRECDAAGRPRRHDHGRLPGDGPEHRPPGGPPDRPRGDRRRAGRDERRRPARVRADRRHLRAHGARAEAQARRGAQGERRGGGDDRRRRQRRAGAEGRAHRHRDGRARHRRGARVGVARPARRRLHLDRAGGAARPADLRQPEEGDGLHLRHPRADCRHVAAAGPLSAGRSRCSRCTSSFSSSSSTRPARSCSRRRGRRRT